MLNISPLLTEWIGYTAATLTTFSFAPQAWLTYKTKDVRGVSLGMYSVLSVGLFLWLLYGLSLNAWPVVAQYRDADADLRHPGHEAALRRFANGLNCQA